MTKWASAPQVRERMLLIAKRLDDAVPPNHCVRLLDEMLGQLDWSPWEAKYHERLGQPAIHPRVLADVLLYGAASVSDRSRTSRHFTSVPHPRRSQRPQST
jgi:transposase